MESLLKRQELIAEAIGKIEINFKKDSSSRKTLEYGQKRLEALEELWMEFDSNHQKLAMYPNKSDDYFTTTAYQCMLNKYEAMKTKLQNCIQAEGSSKTSNSGVLSKTDELMNIQGTNFRALSRMIRKINPNVITQKWEIEEKLQMLQSRWKVIDDTHWELDSYLIGSNLDYEEEFSRHEDEYEAIKRELHCKLDATSHQQRSLPPIEIPTFSGAYTQWPTFMDLYCEAIHHSTTLTKAQKMQHLKGKLRGEAERIIQHLTISADNYDTCWEILTNRYNNKQLLFSKQIQTFMNQPIIQQQGSFEIKRLYDTSMETIHAIHNLGIDTTTWDPILVHILTGKLDAETYSSYMETRKQPRELPSFDELMDFLQRKFTALEPVTRKKPLHPHQPQSSYSKPTQSAREYLQSSYKENLRRPSKNLAGKTSYHLNYNKTCPLCNGEHYLLFCSTFKNMEPKAKLKTIAKLNVCQNCMYSHNGKQCTSVRKCRVCNVSHHTTLHDILREVDSLSNQKPTQETSNQIQHKTNHISGDFNEVLLATALIKVKSADGTFHELRCLLDQGSQINLITESAVQRLGLHRRKQHATISGVGLTTKQSNGTVQLVCESLSRDYAFTTEAVIMNKMLNNLPNYTFEKQQWDHLRSINLADPDYNIAQPIDVLLDAGIYADIIMTGILRGSPEAPVAQQTKLGWILLGNIKTFNCHATLTHLDDICKYWEMEEIVETRPPSPDSNFCETLYSSTTQRRVDGRYEVKIPMKPNFEQHLGTSKPQAVAQFLQLERKMSKNNNYATTYKEFIDEYLELDHMKLCLSPREPSYYTPHHGVLRPDSTTTKLRVVFNASAKTSLGHSLNDLMECGPNIQQDLQAIIMRWRTFQFVYTADIEKFYRQILVREEDQHLQKIVWRHAPTDPIKEYQLTTVTYGTKSAPFLAMRTVKQLIKDDGHNYPLASAILEHQLYVDDLLGGSHSIDEARLAQSELINMMKGGGFNLRKWASNSVTLLENLPDHLVHQNMLNFKHAETNKTLGINWSTWTDNFTFKYILNKRHEVLTKRKLLSDISTLYDPLGWLSPLTVKAKLIFQQTWTLDTTWDAPLPDCIQQEWEQFRLELPQIERIEIPRLIGITTKAIQLHGFCDASERAYACVIYCKSVGNLGETIIKLVAGKTKLAPLKKPISLPKLELCGALLLSRLMKKTIDSINVQTVTIFGWTDSMVVLGWLQGNPCRWKSFVSNRSIKITDVMPSSRWNHVRSEDNPVDCASRGLTPTQLISHPFWWEGPSWLKNDTLPLQKTFETKEEEKNVKQVLTSQSSTQLIQELLEKHSSVERVIRVLSWILRFTNNTRFSKGAKRTSHLTTSDLENAKSTIIKAVQRLYFASEITQLQHYNRVQKRSNILNLNPVLDKQNVLRVGGRLERANLNQNQKHPIILPYNHKLTELLIDQAHRNTLHGGARLTLSYLRNNYWIISGMKAVKKLLTKCVRCHRFKNEKNHQFMADLPPQRVTPSRPFTHTGVDFTGHVEVKANKGRGIKTAKAYIAVFVCLCTKAIHLELVSDLSTSAFLNALKRLCARRGTPRHMYSDNGTNFVGAARTLDKERKEALQQYLSEDVLTNLSEWGIDWHFNAPAWPTAGGLWEAAVKSLKHHLKRVLGDQKLTFEEFITLLTQIEACLNSRPLVALTEDIDNIDCLTPAHFLIGEPALAPPPSRNSDHVSLRTRWQLTEKMFKDFWKRWSNEYLQTLQTRSKWHFPTKNLDIGDIVIVKEDNIPPAQWILGRVMETHPGADGRVRVVTIKTKTNIIKRPVTKLSRLPVESSHAHTKPTVQADVSVPSKRKNRRGTNLCNSIFQVLLSLLLLCTAASTQQTFNITSINPARIVYFDKVADMQIIQDEWKMVVYYNMTTYWRSLDNIQHYVDHLKGLTKKQPSFITITTQFQHELRELQHYNNILRSENNPTIQSPRKRRGLVNGIGYVANTLFGVLDERFAEQYEKDIQSIQSNENHLLNLYKNHTSIIESEYNLLKRNEDVMNKQFAIIDQHLTETREQVTLSQNNAMYITATALAANVIISNIRRVQQQLLDLVTDVRGGRVDFHLIKPDQFENQLNIISGQLPNDLSLPCVNTHKHCTRELYRLARVKVRTTTKFLVFEIRLPLISSEHYELNYIIPIPQIMGQTEKTIEVTSDYLAVNLIRDMIIPLKNQDITTCTNLQPVQLLCAIHQPVYNIKTAEKLCEAQIVNKGNLATCQTRISRCNDRWIRLHKTAAWFFSCCEECTVRIFCASNMTSLRLRGVGVITLPPDCMLKGESFVIHARHDYHSELKLVDDDSLYLSESNINNIMESDVNRKFKYVPEDHKEILTQLKTRIEEVKEQQQNLHIQGLTLSTHNYVQYSIIGCIGTLLIAWGILRIKGRHHNSVKEGQNSEQPTRGSTSSAEIAGVIVNAAQSVDRASSP